VRKVDAVVDIRTHRESPQHPAVIDKVGGGGDAARSAVGSDDDVGTKLGSGREREPLESPVTPQRFGRTIHERFGACTNRGLVERCVELDAREREGMAGIGEAGEARESNPMCGGSDDNHVAHRHRTRDGDAEVGEELDSSWAYQVAARLVARELGLVDERDPGAASGQYRRRDAARRPRSNDERIEAPSLHRPPRRSRH
jgi:hypothetical protein